MAQHQNLFRNRLRVTNYYNNIDYNRQATVQKPNCSHSFRPTYLVSRAFGLMPFSIVYHSNGDIDRPKISIFDGLWFALSLCFYLCGIYMTAKVTIFNQIKSRMSLVSTVGYTICCELGLILGYISIIVNMANRSKLIDIIKKFTIFDQEVSQNEK